MTDEMREERRRKEGKQLQGKKLDVQLKIIRDKPLFFWRGGDEKYGKKLFAD